MILQYLISLMRIDKQINQMSRCKNKSKIYFYNLKQDC